MTLALADQPHGRADHARYRGCVMPKLKGADLRVTGPVAGAPQWLTEGEIRHLVDHGRVVVMWPSGYAHGLDDLDLQMLTTYRRARGDR